MYARSSSDYTTLKRDQELKNNFDLKESGNWTQVMKINTLRNTCHTDDEGNIIPSTWSNIALPMDCSGATIGNLAISLPLPLMTVEPLWSGKLAWKKREFKSCEPCEFYSFSNKRLKKRTMK